MPGGVRCAVGVCKNTTTINATHPDKYVMFHRFPKDKNVHQIWIQRCRRQEKINGKNARVCSEHFTKDDYLRDLQAELLGLPPTKRLKPTAVPTLKLFDALDENGPPQKRQRRRHIETRTKQILVQEILVAETIKHEEEEEEENVMEEIHILMPDLSPSKSGEGIGINDEPIGLSYEDLLMKYDAVLKENEEIKRQLQLKDQLLNESKARIEDLEKELGSLTSKFKLENTYRIQIEKAVRRVFSKGQMDFIIGQKKKIIWSLDDITKAFALRYLSKRAYIYLRQTLKYPLPGISSLQSWASKLQLGQGVWPAGTILSERS